MRVTMAVVLLIAMAGCADSPAQPATTSTIPSTAADPCLELPGSAWSSLRLLLGGETPGGGTGQENWILVFADTDVEWWHTDVVATLAYTCDSGSMSAGEPWREINPGFVFDGAGAVLVEWAGELYERVESPFE